MYLAIPNTLSLSHFFLIFFFFFKIFFYKLWSHGEGEGEIRTSDLRIMRRGPQPIVLPLEVSYLMTSYIQHWCGNVLVSF